MLIIISNLHRNTIISIKGYRLPLKNTKNKQMKKFITVLVFSIVVITLNSCKNANGAELSGGKGAIENTTPAYENWEIISESDYSISYPKNWTLDQSGTDGVAFMITSPSESDGDKFTQNVNMVIENLGGEISLDQYADAAVNQLKHEFPNNYLKKEKKKFNRIDYYKIIFFINQNGMDFKLQQHYFVKNNKAYVLGFTTGIDDFDKDIALGEKILKTFKLK